MIWALSVPLKVLGGGDYIIGANQAGKDALSRLFNCMYRRVPRDIPPPPPPPKKNGPCFNERINVIMNAAACYSLKSCWSTSSFLEFKNRCAEALTSTKIRSFKHGPFFLGGGGGGGGGYIAVLYGISISTVSS